MVALTVVRAMFKVLNCGGAPLVMVVTLSNRLGVVRSPVAGVLSCEKANRPASTSHTVLEENT